MGKYTVGIKLDNYEYCDISDEKLMLLRDSIVVIALDKSSNNELYTYYNSLEALIVNGNRPIIIMVANESKIRKQLCMLMVSYEKYDMYTVDSIEDIDEDYISAVEDRSPSKEEVRAFISSDVAAYSEINELLTEIINAVNDSDIDKLHQIVTDKKDIICSSIDIIDYMKRAINSINKGEYEQKLIKLMEINAALEAALEAKNKELKDAGNLVESITKERDAIQKEAFNAKVKLQDLQDELNSTKREVSSARIQLQDLQEQLNIGGPVIRTYSELQTSTIKCKVKSIVYFKEITYVRYVNSYIDVLLYYINKVKKLKAKLLIYDNRHAFINMYLPMNIIGSSEYMSNRDSILNSDKNLVIIEANKAIIEDILKEDYDVIIIYDRLRQATDIVTGNNVYKYWVINSKAEYNALSTQFKIDKQYVISRPGLFSEGIALSDISEYNACTYSGKVSNYLKMHSNIGNKKTVIESIVDRTNISAIAARG